ncbi:septum formation inhibitor Maf [Cellulophaga baltica]|uniref:septum formation inhibitor Maf n=1 Tax=Cellulophaga TaxID=104264 RepID=UPI001C07CCB4|nr:MULTISPECIES: septum formation inhibitor Maf [Cellulophaga]MBU2997309.1 septum formation inhibitor Maf [Cellulophaga baltica]MDO6768707.1 septum formation inhibitor Maf [Cellulophaga sp. 1_MG-2023]
MKKVTKIEQLIIASILIITIFVSCKTNDKSEDKSIAKSEINEPKPEKKELSSEFKEYWYSGNAEITSYNLKQARYGQFRPGSTVLIYVTEPFLAGKQVKADGVNPDNIPVLKLNSVKNYITGIYPYSLMTSSFYPVHDDTHSVKLSFSAQEWCGHIFAQLNNREKFEIQSNSYFESEADQKFSLEKTHLENELWNKIRIDPSNLPTGDVSIIPSLEFLRQTHKELKAYKATIKIENKNKTIQTYTLEYPELERTLAIDFTTAFPHTIEGWRETYPSGHHGSKAELMTTTAEKNKSIKTPYWKQNTNSDLFLRDSLGL